jgi:membrane protein YdbS with pleckstrin-like domain
MLPTADCRLLLSFGTFHGLRFVLYLVGFEYHDRRNRTNPFPDRSFRKSRDWKEEMSCSKCGAYVAPGVRFCSNCGAPASDSEATQVARRASPSLQGGEGERTIFTVRPTLIFIKAGYALAVLSGIALVFLLAMISIPAYISIPLALALLLIPAYYHIRRNMVRYTVTDAKMEIDTGLIARTTRNIPLSKIQDVTVQASIPQRMLGFGDIIVDNASEVGGSTIFRNINNPRHYADLLLRELRRWQ